MGHVRRGFTLIELLVVIAIIGILSSVVLASLNTARSKGVDAKIQSEIRSIQVNAEIYYDNQGNQYGSGATVNVNCTGGLFGSTANPNISQILTDLNAASATLAPSCTWNNAGYAIQHQLTANGVTTQGGAGAIYFCADSTGKVGTSSTALVTSGVVCP